MEKQKTIVRVAGKEYTLVSADSPEYISRVANYVERRITETVFATRMNKENAAVLVSLNMADELMKAQDENARLRRELNATRKTEE